MTLPGSCAGRLVTQLECLPILFAGVSESAVNRQPAPGKWSARENLAHLARYHQIFLARIERIRHEDRPLLERYRAEEDPEWPGWAALPADEVVGRLHQLRSGLIDYVLQLSPGELTRVGVHPRFGEMSVLQWLEFFLLHEAHHLLAVMQRMRERP